MIEPGAAVFPLLRGQAASERGTQFVASRENERNEGMGYGVYD